jgi:hypothetical protein
VICDTDNSTPSRLQPNRQRLIRRQLPDKRAEQGDVLSLGGPEFCHRLASISFDRTNPLRDMHGAPEALPARLTAGFRPPVGLFEPTG